jgi:hypothetical protein
MSPVRVRYINLAVRARGRWEEAVRGTARVNSARIRAPGEQAMGPLKSWRLLRKLSCGTTRITDLVKAVILHFAA